MLQKNYKKIAANISEDSKSWMRQYESIAPKEIEKRNKSAYGIKNVSRIVLGLFTKPQFNDVEVVFIFEGLRNKEYMRAFSPESVVLVGSHLEKDYAKSQGYGFCWSFPIVSAVQSKMHFGGNYPINRQLKYWIGALSKFKRVTLFLYEDTQPLGVFFVHLGRLLKSKVSSVCIQHGIFYNMKYPIRVDGELSDINFVWNNEQISVIGCNRSKAFDIGLPYNANATSTKNLIVVMVGTGMPLYGNNYYENSLNLFSDIQNLLSQGLGLKVFYRPHPNEWAHEDIIIKLREKFVFLDKLEKTARLNGPRTVFIGEISSFLYEAKLAGHLVAHSSAYDEVISDVDCNFTFNSCNLDDLVEWIEVARAKESVGCQFQDSVKTNPMERFICALHAAKIIDDNDVKKP